MQDVARLRVRHHGHIPVPAAERGFVHRKAPDRFRLAARKSPRHRTLHDSIHRVPAQPHPPGDRLDARFLQPRDHFRLEVGRVPGTALRPRHPDGDHTVLRALDPRHVADQKRLVAPGVQVPPFAAARIVARARLAAARTPQRTPPGPFKLHPKLLRLPNWLHPGDLPLRAQAQNSIQPIPSGHVCELPSVSLWDSCRRPALPAADHAISSESRDPERQPAAPSVQQQYPWPEPPPKPLVRGRRGFRRRIGDAPASPVPHPTRRHTVFACESLPARSMIQLPMLPTHHDR